MVSITAKSTYFKELLFPFFKIFYTLIVYYVINFVFSIGKQPYREVINFVVTCSIYSYRDICVRHLANIIDIQWSRPVLEEGGPTLYVYALQNLFRGQKMTNILAQHLLKCNEWALLSNDVHNINV